LVIFAGLKYRHSYHAGNVGDVLKHIVLVAILRRLTAKPGALFFLDTHAGRGAYDLGNDARPRGEAAAGILQLAAAPDPPECVVDYLQLVRAHTGITDRALALRSYPGSGRFAQLILRPQDRAVLCELVRAEAAALRRLFGADRRFRIVHGDGYAAIRAHVPPPERRGLVLIDPAYESQQAEFALVEHALDEGHRRWATGVFAIWYPIKRRAPVEGFHARLRASGVRRILCAELSLYAEDSRVGMNGSGMIVVNPPFPLERTLHEALPALHAALGGRAGSGYTCSWLVPE
jgi:23S rRNA (adenine2030-N6)-methyltransferase